MPNCPCPTDIVPTNPCCPNTTDLASSIVVKDKDCNDRRIVVNSAGVLAARNNKAGMMDGSAEKPLIMNFETFFAADGYVLLQDPGGRVIAIKPDVDLTSTNAILQFVYEGGAWKLVPLSHDNLFSDKDTPSNAKGIMALLACGGPQGLLKLGKFIPFPQALTGGPWPIVVDKDNQVFASSKAINEIPATDSVDKLDVLLGAVDGKWKTILPVKNKILVGVETAGAVKWELKDDTSAYVSVARTNIYSRSAVIADGSAILAPATIDIKTLLGYKEEFTFAVLHFVYRAATWDSDMTHDVAVDGRNYVGIYLNAGSGNAENNHNTAIVAIPTTKSWTITNTRSWWQVSGLPNGAHNVDIYLDGWMK